MHETRTILIAQAPISFMMAMLMTGFFSLPAFGPTRAWLECRMQNFILAWPVAFCLSLIASKIAFRLTARGRST